MECSLFCQICCTGYGKFYSFRQHLFSEKHRQMLQDLFPTATIHCSGTIPYIVFVNSRSNPELKKPVVGLSLLTLCFSQSPTFCFYLCHVCETKCPMENILGHIFSQEHCFNYFVYTNPDDVSFAWKPDLDMKSILWHKLKSESRKTELQNLQVLHLPALVLEKLMSSTYSEVMHTLGENGKLVERFESMHQNGVTLRGYHSSHNRKHPLLGLQHIVECVCFEPGEKKYYLCTLCCFVMPNHMIIKHVLSFDHLHCYFKAWHPSTLLSKESYKDYDSFVHVVLDFAKQAEKIHAAKNVSMQQVNLQPNDFKLVNFKSYPQALKSLESITKSSLTIAVKPGNKLEYPSASNPSTQTVKCWLHCQNCSSSFSNICKYVNHLTEESHIAMMQKHAVEDIFSAAGRGHGYGKRGKFYVGLYPYVCDCLKSNQPLVGTSLVVTCLSSVANADPFYLCFACRDSFSQSTLKDHFESRKHLISTQLYQNPWQLPFGWEGDLDDKALRWTAWKEEKQSINKVTLKIFDVPYSIFLGLDLSDYKQVLRRLYLTDVSLKHKVPQCNTYTKLQQKEKFPFLGLEFLVVHNLTVRPNKQLTGCVCLLCERKLDKEEIEAHIFSREHVSKFLDCFHPGSLDSYTVDTETLLDLAKQAAQLHFLSNIQIICLEKPIWEPCTYNKAKRILTATKWRTENETLVPPIRPKWKLVSRISPKEANKRHETDDQKTSPVTDGKEKGPHKEEQGSGKETGSKEEKDPAGKQGSQKDCPKNLKNEGETALSIKLTTGEPMTEKEMDALTKQEGSSSFKPDTKCHQKSERKRPSSPEKSTTESRESECKMSLKRQRLASKDDFCFEESIEISNIRTTVETTDTVKDEEKHKVIDKVLRTCIEWRCDKQESIYLCGHCYLKIPKKDITSHVEGGDHPKMFSLVVHLGEEMYGRISKQCFQSGSLQKFLYEVMKKVQRPNPWFDSGLSLTSFQTCVTPNSASAAPCCQQELKEKVEQISVECGAETVATCRTGQGKPSHTPSPVPRSNKEPTDGTNNAGSSPRSTKSKSKVGVTPNHTKSLTIEAAAKPEELRAVPSTSSINTCKSTTASCRPTETASTTLKTSTPQSPKTSMSPKSQSIKTSKETCNAIFSANTGPAETDKPEHPLKCDKTKSKAPEPPKKKGTSDTSKTAKQEVTNVNPEAKTLTGRNPDNETAAHKRKLPASPHQNPEEIKKLRKDQPHVDPNKMTPSGNLPKVGLNQLIVVCCEEKQQVYCLLCSVKLNSSSHYHLTSSVHQYKYVKWKYPEWSAKELEKQLNHTVSLLAVVEKTLPHTRSPQKLKVKKDVYQKLGNLPDHLAVERVKALVKETDLQATSSPTIDSTEHPCHDISSPCDVSSSGIPAFHDEMSDSADCNQPEQENRYPHQTSLDQTSGQSVRDKSLDEEDFQVDDDHETFMQTDQQQILDQWTQAEDMAESETILKRAEKHCAAEVQRLHSSSCKDTKTNDLIQDQRQSICSNKIIPEPIPDSKAEDVTETLQLDQFKVQDDDQPNRKVKLSTEGLGLTVEITHKNVDHLLTAEKQHWESDATLQDPQKAVEYVKKVSPVKVCSVELEVVAGQQNQSRLSHNAEPAPKLRTQSEEHSTSQANPPNLLGRRAQGSSHLSIYLKASRQDPTQVTGMDYVWECRGISHKTFFLCEICEKMLSAQDICQHMVSLDHHLKYLRTEDPRFLEMFWVEEDLPQHFKIGLLKEVIKELSRREQFHKLDAKCILLRSESHEFVRTAPFSEALQIVKNVTDGHRQSVFPLPAGHQKSEHHQNGEQTADSRSIQEYHSIESPSAQVPEKNQGSKIAGQNTEKAHSKEASLVDCLDERTSRTAMKSSSSKTDHAVFPDPIVGQHVSHREVCSSPAQQPEFKTAILQLKQNQSPLEVKSSSSNVYPVVPVSSTVCVDPSQEPCRNSLQLHDKLSVSQIEGTPGPLELNAPYSKASAVVPLSSLNPSQETCSGRPLQPKYKPAVSQLRRKSSPPDVNSSNSVADLVSSSSASLNQQTWSVPSHQPQFTPAVPQLPSSDLVQLSESTSAVSPNLQVSIRDELPLTKERAAASMMENFFKTRTSLQEPLPAKCIEAPKTFESESSFLAASASSSVNPVKEKNACMGPNDWKIVSNLISMLKGTNHSPSASNITESRELIKVNYPLSVSKDNAIVPTADLRDLQRLEINVPQDVCRIKNPEPNETGITQLPVNTIITPRSNYIKQTCKGQTPINVNRHQQLSCHSDPRLSPTDDVEASGGVSPYTPAAYLPSAHPGFAPAQSHFPLNTLSIYQQCIYPGQTSPQQPANPVSLHSFGYSLTAQMPLGWRNVDMQQYYMMQRPESDQ